MTGSLAKSFFCSGQRVVLYCIWLVLNYIYTFDTWTFFPEHFNVNATFVDLLGLELSRWECRKCILVVIFEGTIWAQFVAAISQSLRNVRTRDCSLFMPKGGGGGSVIFKQFRHMTNLPEVGILKNYPPPPPPFM